MLLVYDGADDLSFLPKLLPQFSAHVHVLITTRCEDCSNLQNVSLEVPLGRLKKEDAMSALTKWSGRQPPNSDEQVAAMKLSTEPPIEMLPIALAHAGTYVRKTHISYEEYYKKLKKEEDNLKALTLNFDNLLPYFKASRLHETLLNTGLTQPSDLAKLTSEDIDGLNISNYDKHVVRNMQSFMSSSHAHLTWQMDVDLVAKENSEALSVLEYASFLSSRDIPENLVRPLVFNESARYQYSLCVSTLSSHNLVEWHETAEGYTLNVHPLVQSTVMERIKQQPDEMEHKLTEVCKTFMFQRPEESSMYQDERFQRLVAHLYSLAKHIVIAGVNDVTCVDLVSLACHVSLYYNQAELALFLSEKLYQIVIKCDMRFTYILFEGVAL